MGNDKLQSVRSTARQGLPVRAILARIVRALSFRSMRAISRRLAEREPRRSPTEGVRRPNGPARFDSLFPEKADSLRASPIRAGFVSAPAVRYRRETRRRDVV
jgi:hypothetical protein